jgi:hypothetical protein
VRNRFFLFGSLLIVTACLSGCRNSNGLYPVRGKVLYRGEPAVGAAVYFHRKDVADPLQEQTSQGIIGQDGAFELAGANGKGALPGEYAVLIEWKDATRRKAPDRFRGRYMNANSPPFTVEVKAEKNHLPPFDLH